MRTWNRRAPAIVAVSAAALVLLAAIGPVTAATPQGVTIVSNVTFADPGEPNFGDFEASGNAVDHGLICESGTFVDTGIRFAGFQSGRGEVQLLVRKEFACEGTGTFFVKLQIQADFDPGIESFTWVVQGGTGEYAHLRGGGTGSTVPTETGNINTYVGFLLH